MHKLWVPINLPSLFSSIFRKFQPELFHLFSSIFDICNDQNIFIRNSAANRYPDLLKLFITIWVLSQKLKQRLLFWLPAVHVVTAVLSGIVSTAFFLPVIRAFFPYLLYRLSCFFPVRFQLFFCKYLFRNRVCRKQFFHGKFQNMYRLPVLLFFS